jgi:AsmA-like C-terminal region
MTVMEKTPVLSPAHRSSWLWIGVIFLFVLAAFLITAEFLRSHAEPILRQRVIETLAIRFHSRVEMAGFHVWLANGLEVSGEGLKIYGQTDPNIHQPGFQALISIDEFHFRTPLLSLLRSPMHVQTVYLKGLVLNIPPAGDRQQMTDMGPRGGKMKIFVDEFLSEDAQLMINTARPDKLPLEFAIASLKMKDIGPGQPLHFDATLLNPKPIGNISSSGLFGPWQADNPRGTPVQGTYSFSKADLGTIKGIAGILSSTGHYAGNLGNIIVDGKTDTPDFRIALSGHPVPLQTEFHAVVDGTSGNTYLQPVKAKVLNSTFVAKGSVVRVKEPRGHEVQLDISIDQGRIEDLLRLGVRTDPPIMTGTIRTKIAFDLRPGAADIAERLRLAGHFEISAAHFSNEKIQTKVDALSMRSQGKPKLANDGMSGNIQSDLQGVFRLQSGILSFSHLDFQVPGTRVDMTGEYSLDGNTFDFHGTARMDAKLSQMVTGWKSILLKPVDPFFKKNGAGTEVPFKITGTKSEPRFGLDLGHNK